MSSPIFHRISLLTMIALMTLCACHEDENPSPGEPTPDMRDAEDMPEDTDMAVEDMSPSPDLSTDLGADMEGDQGQDMDVDMPPSNETGFDGVLDGSWANDFGLSGASGGIGVAVYDLEEGDAGEIYVGGLFRYMSGVQANNIARWDGAAWHPLAQGVPLLVESLEWDSQNATLYVGGRDVGGDFGLPTPNTVKKWDGTTWSDLGFLDGENPAVHVIKRLSDGRIAVGGRFDGINGSGTPALTIWDGMTWSAWGSGLGESDEVFEIIEDDQGRPCIGGQFSPMFSQSVGVACWDTTTQDWVGLIDGLPPGRVSVLEADGEDGALIAGGQFTYFNQATGELRAGLARWDGTQWTALDGVDGGDVNSVRALATDPQGNLIVGGRFGVVDPLDQALIVRDLAMRMPNGDWAEVGNLTDPLEVFIPGLAGAHDILITRSGELAVAGIYVEIGETSTSGVAFQRSGQWQPFVGDAQRFEGLNGIASEIVADSHGVVYVLGGFSQAGSARADGLARWTGEQWEAISSGFGELALISGMAIHPETDELWLHGEDLLIEGSNQSYSLVRWDGQQWHGIDSQTDGLIQAIAFHEEDVYIGGEFSTVAGVMASRIARWDGMSWSPVGEGLGGAPGDAVSRLAVGQDGTLWATGSFAQTGSGGQARGFARWDGTMWQEAGGGLANGWTTLELKVDGDNVWLCGNFERANDGTLLNSITRWDGDTWHALDEGLTSFGAASYVGAMLPSGEQVIATGTFDFEETGEAHLAWWDGQAWHPIGQGMADLGEGLVLVGDDLWIAGLFNSVGANVPSFGVARWTIERGN